MSYENLHSSDSATYGAIDFGSVAAGINGLAISCTAASGIAKEPSQARLRAFVLGAQASVVVAEAFRSFGVQAKYRELFAALDSLRHADPEDSMWIDDETYRSACGVLCYLSYHHLAPPKIFSHGGDAVVFTWSSETGPVNLTVSNGIAALGYGSAGQVKYVDLAEVGVGELFKFAKVVGGQAGSNPSL